MYNVLVEPAITQITINLSAMICLIILDDLTDNASFKQ